MERATVLIATRDAALRALLAETLRREGARCLQAADRPALLHAVRVERPDLLFLDGDVVPQAYDLIPELQARSRATGIVLLVWETDREQAVEAVSAGVMDFVTKPVDRDQFPLRAAVALERSRLSAGDRRDRMALEQRVNVKTQEVSERRDRLRRQMLSAIEALAQSMAAKHRHTEDHARRVTGVAGALARALRLPSGDVRAVELAARFHDIGKIGVRDDVLDKRGALTGAEYDHVKTHPLVAERILGSLDDFASVLPLVKHEHERFDGTGYPDGLRGEAIPLGSRIIAVADAYDALVSVRSYRSPCTSGAALDEIRRCAGTQFDPVLVDLFERLVRDGTIRPPADGAAPPKGVPARPAGRKPRPPRGSRRPRGA